MTDFYAGVDLGGTNIAFALADAEGRILDRAAIPTASHEGPQGVLARIAAQILKMTPHPRALGMGVPGLIDLDRGITRFFPNFPTQWRDVPVADILSARLNCPVRLLNDARAAALGELTFGKGKSARTMVFFTLGTGIGGGVVVDGKLHLGPLGAAGELGHQTILPDGPLCGCGNHGCLEALASGPAITAEGVRLMKAGLAPKLYAAVDGDAGQVTPKIMTEAALAGDSAVHDALLRAARFLGIGVANMVTALHPDLIVLGGGVAGIGGLLFDTVRATVHARVRMFPVDGVRIEPSALGDAAGVLGAIALARSAA
jgi:glucokinase